MATPQPSPTSHDFRACLAETPTVVSTSAGPIEYAERGTGEPLLVVHGTSGGWDQGLVIAERLRADGFHIVAPSRPGYLGTPLSTGRTFAEQGDALAALLDALAIERIKVVAFSGGGPSAYELAARHPERVLRLVQVDSICIPGPLPPGARLVARDSVTKAFLWLLRHAPKGTLTMVLQSLGGGRMRDASRVAAIMAADPVRMAQLEATFLATLDASRRRGGIDNDLKPFTPAALDRITCPTLIVHARSDKAAPPSNAEYAHAHIAGSELYWMDGSHVAFGLEAAESAPAYAAQWLRGG